MAWQSLRLHADRAGVGDVDRRLAIDETRVIATNEE